MRETAGLLIRNSDVLSSELSGEVVLLKPDTGDCYSLAGAGAVIWRTASRACDIGELAAAVRREYDVPEAQALADVESFLGRLLDEGLIVRASVA